MILTHGHKLVFTMVILPALAFPSSGHTLPTTDPRLSEFVWFSSFTSPDELGNEDTSSTVNINPFLLPGALEPLADLGKENDNSPKASKMAIRL